MIVRFFALFCSCLLWMQTNIASAQDNKEIIEPLTLTEQGNLAFAAGDYNKALKIFLEAYEQTHNPNLLFNAAQCYRALGNNAKAIEYYESYLSAVPDSPKKEQIQTTIETLRDNLPVEEPSPFRFLVPGAFAISAVPLGLIALNFQRRFE